MTCTVQGLKRSTQYKFRVRGGVNVRGGGFQMHQREQQLFYLPILGLFKEIGL